MINKEKLHPWKINMEHVLTEVWKIMVPFFSWVMAVGSSRSSSRV